MNNKIEIECSDPNLLIDLLDEIYPSIQIIHIERPIYPGPPEFIFHLSGTETDLINLMADEFDFDSDTIKQYL